MVQGPARSILPSLGSLLAGLAAALPLLVLAALALRPYLQTVRGQTDPAMIRQVASLQRLERTAGRRAAPVLRVKPLLGALVPRDPRRYCSPAPGQRARAAAGAHAPLTGRPRQAVAAAAAPVGPAVRDHRLVGAGGALGPGRGAVAAPGAHRLVPVVLPGLLLLALSMSAQVTSLATTLWRLAGIGPLGLDPRAIRN